MNMQKVVLVTGGNKGIGLEVTRYFLDINYKVIAIARDFSNFEFAGNADVKTIEYDLSKISGIPKLISQVGRVDVLVNNAGVMLSVSDQSNLSPVWPFKNVTTRTALAS